MKIHRHKAAISRNELSKPVFVAMQQKIIHEGDSIFDYGCGKGTDVSILKDQGYNATGWDPFHASKNNKTTADIVNLGYVINVIEDPSERIEVLKEAFQYAKRCLIVSAQVLTEGQQTSGESYSDGIITKRNTFQKYFSQNQLCEYIKETLDVDPIPACLGVFFVFKDDREKERFLADKYIRRYACRPRKSLQEKLEPHLQLLESFANTVGVLGRLPKSDEFPKYQELKQHVGGPRKALEFCSQLFENFNFDDIERNRRRDIIVYFSTAMLRGQLKIKNLDDGIKKDIKIIFGSLAEVKAEASSIIHKLRNHNNISLACSNEPIGKLLPDALYVHIDYLNSLSPLLRVYVACATTMTGNMDDATLIKINKRKRKVSFLYYDAFDKNPHPPLLLSVVADLSHLTVKEWPQSKDNPPILHRKENFVGNDYPLHDKFAKLTRQEERANLFEGNEFIGRKNNWDAILLKKGLRITGHRLLKL